MTRGHLELAVALGLVTLGRATAPVGEVVRPNREAADRIAALDAAMPSEHVETRQMRRAREREEVKRAKRIARYRAKYGEQR